MLEEERRQERQERGMVKTEPSTVMYSVGEKGEIVEHNVPWDRKNPFSAEKFARLMARGFTFERPRTSQGDPHNIAGNIETIDLSSSVSGDMREILEEAVEGEGLPILEPFQPAKVVSEAEIKKEVEIALYPCPDCEKRFRTIAGVMTHRRVHNPNRNKSGRKPKGKSKRARVKGK